MLLASVWRSAISFAVSATKPRVTVAFAPAQRAVSDLASMPSRAPSARVFRPSAVLFQSVTAAPSVPRSTSDKSPYVMVTGPASLEVLGQLGHGDGSAVDRRHLCADLRVLVLVQPFAVIQVVRDVRACLEHRPHL